MYTSYKLKNKKTNKMSHDTSHIMSTVYWNVIPEDICHCTDDWYSYGGEDCDCPKNPRVIATKVSVDVIGNPIRFKPGDATYIVKIWESETTQEDLDFSEEENISFSLCSTIDPRDLKILHKKYIINRPGIEQKNYNYRFRAPCSVESYKLTFRDLTLNLVSSMESSRSQSDCAHVERCKKKI
jgi:hypothetical protein